MTEGSIFWMDGADPELVAAAREAQANFRYFWREAAWEMRRIIPGCDLLAVKAPFTDAREPGFFGKLFGRKPDPVVEHMWIGSVTFDGRTIRGELMNAPNDVRTVKQGDQVEVPLSDISDWMYSTQGTVCGGWTVNLLRSRMTSDDREQHDSMWGLDFGDPHQIDVVPSSFSGPPEAEHPMSRNMAEPYREQLAENGPELLGPDPSGWTQLHHMALAGGLSPVRVLLEAGADRSAQTPDGRTALELAETMGWTEVVALLRGPDSAE